jgi:hypothetical protein
MTLQPENKNIKLFTYSQAFIPKNIKLFASSQPFIPKNIKLFTFSHPAIQDKGCANLL